MINLLITILLFSGIIVLFKFFEKYKVNNLQALIVNYIVAGILGLVFSKASLNLHVIDKPWFLHAAMIGILFIVVFNFYAFGTQKVGIAISTVANKMSLVIPVIVSLYLYHNDTLTLSKGIGLSFALVGIILASMKDGGLSFKKSYIWIILAIFIGQGIADALFADAQIHYVNQRDNGLFFVVLFLFAAITGIIMLTGKSVKSGLKLESKNIVWGGLLGVVNYFCLYFMGLAIQSKELTSSEVFPMVSMGVVLMSAVIGTLFYNQKLTRGNWIGIGFAILAIAFINFGKYFF
jgi:drug/metabolite transporter (DMT)-like permease